MPTFSSAPPADAQNFNLPLMRCPTKGKLIAIVTSDDLTGCKTHFWGGRTVPCEDLECAACPEGVPWRWHSYLSAFLPTKGLHFIFESTARATEPFIQYRQAHGSLRGCLFQATRATSRSNSRVNIQTKPADLSVLQLPEAPQIPLVLATIWNMKLKEVVPTGHVRGCNGVAINKSPHANSNEDADVTQVASIIDRLVVKHPKT